MLYLLLGFIGLLIGILGFYHFGWLFGFALGLLAAEMFTLRKRLSRLEESIIAEKQKSEKIPDLPPAESPVPVHPIV